ncbi:GNAT family N-acetyltransferase [Pseudoalteromonas denitrificans]|uniref:Protein N-acetyltransferase, RimJ/RimL family n=1 Tax=Pseudoalteromonas denitrificans DSM 6059 TaxID=1123010 RepID=A0A1I1KFF7_9GAMM|nr:GNAT family N-acetyltransferase [Pseudoalteromonas denitrificans]SFC57448.1 Protein N-acetyltransferase, RimJ/RimL family [Pseudoalteromonas denitrificans DSM 6059]
MSKVIAITQRLMIRQMTIDDGEFILHHFNEPLFIKNIADKKIKSLEAAKQFIIDGPQRSYQENGFGMFIVLLKDSNTPVGTCGLLKRDNIDDIDLGYALVSKYHKKGYLQEAAIAVLNYAKNELQLNRIVGYTATDNNNSMNALNKLGFSNEGVFDLAGYDTPSNRFVLNFSSLKKSV